MMSSDSEIVKMRYEEMIKYYAELDVSFNGCSTAKEYFGLSLLDEPRVQIIFGILYSLIWILAVSGNAMVLTVIAYTTTVYSKTKAKNTAFPVRSVFVGSLAASDLLICIFSLPVTAVTGFTNEWIFPSFMCHCIGFIQAFGIFQSSFTLANLAIDRCLLIVYSQRNLITFGRARLAVIGTAVIAVAMASPMAVFMHLEKQSSICGEFCVERWPDTVEDENTDIFGHYANTEPKSKSLSSSGAYSLFVTLFQVCLPTIVTIVCYLLISMKLGKQERLRRAQHLLMPEAEKRLTERRRRTNRMMVCMVSAFVLLWLPLNAMNIMRDFKIYEGIMTQSTYRTVHSACHLLAMVSLIWNPFIYAWYNESIRSAVVSICIGRRRTVPSRTIRESARMLDAQV